MPVVFTKDDLRSAVEAASGGQQTVLYDVKGYPSIVQIIPKFNIEDINPSLGSGIHPAFIVGGVEKAQIYIAVYPAAVVDGLAVSISGKAPANYVTYDQAKTCCTAKGVGWHLMTNWEWAALALWCVKNGTEPRGNTYWRRSHEAAFETGGAVDGGKPGAVAGDGRTFGGSGPASWRHNNSFQGIANLVGNVWEWQGGMKLIDGQIYMANDNDFNLPEAQWPAQGVYFDSSAGPGDGVGVAHNGTPILSNGISKYSETPTPAGGGDERDLDYAHIGGASGWQQTGISSSYAGLTLAVRRRMAQALINPKIESSGQVLSTAKGGIWVRNYGERLPLRGGNWANGADAGLAALFLNGRRVGSSDNAVGFRPAFSS